MTALSRTVLGLCCVTSTGIIGYVHYKQFYEREQLHIGVVRDLERQERIKRENIWALQRQIDLTKELQRDEDAEKKTLTNNLVNHNTHLSS